MTTYLYPRNLKAKANLWLWSLRDFVILAVSALLSAVIAVYSGILYPAALSMCFGFMTIRLDDSTVLNYFGLAARYILTSQKYYEWR